jgi:hypothetical protein
MKKPDHIKNYHQWPGWPKKPTARLTELQAQPRTLALQALYLKALQESHAGRSPAAEATDELSLSRLTDTDRHGRRSQRRPAPPAPYSLSAGASDDNVHRND